VHPTANTAQADTGSRVFGPQGEVFTTSISGYSWEVWSSWMKGDADE